jgi:hypothetical protein
MAETAMSRAQGENTGPFSAPGRPTQAGALADPEQVPDPLAQQADEVAQAG